MSAIPCPHCVQLCPTLAETESDLGENLCSALSRASEGSLFPVEVRCLHKLLNSHKMEHECSCQSDIPRLFATGQIVLMFRARYGARRV